MELKPPTLDKAIELGRKAIELKCEEENRSLKKREDEVFADNARRGWPPNNPPILGKLLEIYKSELSGRGEMAYAQLRALLERLQISFSDELESKLEAEVIQFLDLQHTIFRNKLSHFNKPFRFPESMLSLEDALLFARRKAKNEIGAFVEELRAVPALNPTSSVTIKNVTNSNIAVVAGHGSSIDASQEVTLEMRTQVIAALDAVAANADEVVAQGKIDRQELHDCLTASKRELEKPKPNSLKLGGILAALAKAIQTIGSLKPAYETLKDYAKQLLSGLGI